MTIYPTLARDFESGPMAAAHASWQGGLRISIENRYQRGMSKGDEEREKRLAEELRQHLRCRKVQASKDKGTHQKPADSKLGNAQCRESGKQHGERRGKT